MTGEFSLLNNDSQPHPDSITGWGWLYSCSEPVTEWV